jgi:hypothetical protein
MIGIGICIGLAMLLTGFKLILMSLILVGIAMSKKEMDALLMMAFLIEQELACEIVYAPHYLKFEHSIIWAN